MSAGCPSTLPKTPSTSRKKGDTAQKQKPTLFGWLARQGAGPKAIELIVLALLAYLVKTELIDRLRPGSRQSAARVIVRPATNVAVHNAYTAAVRQLARKGLNRAPSMTAVEFGALVAAHTPQGEIGSTLTALTILHNRFYYGSETASAQDVTQAQDLLARPVPCATSVQTGSCTGAGNRAGRIGMRPRLVVLGSANMDLVVHSSHIAAPGETVLGHAFRQIPGGKGANQAVAAARLGAAVAFVGRVGNDAFGEQLRSCLQNAGIDATCLRSDPNEPTGVALIGVDDRGQNAITVASGANFRVDESDVEDASPFVAEASALLLQLEIPPGAVRHAISRARQSGIRVILNPAPASLADPLPDALLAQIDVLTPNEHEAAALLGYETTDGLDWMDAAARLHARGVKFVIITLGAEGCVLADATGVRHIPAIPVTAVDTTAAGDCFTGALAVALAEGRSPDAAAGFAAAAAAISVTRSGAQPSLPFRSEVDAALSTR